ncbi:MAG TPA: DEAD/DEAH box helicase [candidate division Zixibacteria bacterium]|nr:DEAD/DEAH box helicase [candidate division Zixibacteria bacterium]MDD4916222.1 DEAD/DEAH box helicase [candidate division Zixibacteria bacterium]MDM7972742.1 DEAD/DEAH box helicase [candidate division Zixibacteria bacterium]HOZ07590.1 DEAD/DEAH box helicase [candidate division Zixibacteria bacterium]HPM37527.1 DEAD/DEAH box helicase [candidate division Zixibacteria bacterium]
MDREAGKEEQTEDTRRDERGGVSPSDYIEPEDALPETTLEAQPERVREAAARAGWSAFMPVQAKTIPYVLARRDLMVQSRTGSGKTGAFLLPILERLEPSRSTCQALILVPTRELARQVAHEAEMLAGGSGVRTAAVYGGVSYRPQIEALTRGSHIVVGTPGRILDHLLKRTFTLDDLDILIFDEADRMLSMGFYPDMIEVQKYLPRRHINSYMFSATYPMHVINLARQFLRDPGFLSLSKDRVHVAETEHVYYVVPHMEKDRYLVRIIELLNPAAAIIFCNTKNMVHYVTVVLQRFGYDADALSADLSQSQREQVLQRVRDGQLKFLVATDLAARGIDIPELTHIFQYEPPEDPELYVHRAGRTGRAGATGEAVALVAGMELTELRRIATRFGIDMIERPAPSEDDVVMAVSERMTALLEARLRRRDKLQVERMARFFPLVKLLSENEAGQEVLAMLVDDYYQESLHNPPPLPQEQQHPRRESGGGPREGGGRSDRKRRRPRRK